MMIKNVVLNFCALFMILIAGSDAFVPAMDLYHSNTQIALNLHPRQAAELEACAYDCYCTEAKALQYSSRRQSSDELNGLATGASSSTRNGSPSSLNNRRRSPATARGTTTGPVAWCRRIISGGSSAANRRLHG